MQARENANRDAHIHLSNAGVPRRNRNGNKLGLRKREKLANETEVVLVR